MYLKIDVLSIHCKKKTITVPFKKNINYFYGKMGAGKTTIVKLIAYCFGDDLIETSALQSEFVSATLRILLDDKIVVLKREKVESSGKVNVQWCDLNGKNANVVDAPIKSTSDDRLIPYAEIYNLSDLLFYLANHTPPKVRRSKLNENSDLIRLTFKNIMWYWYLEQDDMDSSFFHLESTSNVFKRNASRDVMRMILGFYYEHVAELESELAEIRSSRLGAENSVIQLGNFLRENGIEDTEKIEGNILLLNQKLHSIQIEKSQVKSTINLETPHVSDETRENIRKVIASIHEFDTAIDCLKTRIEKINKLKEEFFSASIKMNNLVEAKNVLDSFAFNTCPNCSRPIQNKTSSETCYLCGHDIDETYFAGSEYTILEKDLKARRDELEVSLNRMNKQLGLYTKEREKFINEKRNLDSRLTEYNQEYDSLYLAKVKSYDEKIEAVRAEISYWEKIKPLSKNIEQLHIKVISLSNDEDAKKLLLDNAIAEANEQENRLKKLKELFLDSLIQVKFPGIKNTDTILMKTKDFYPQILALDNDLYEVNYLNLSSGGKKTIFKCCFAIAIQRLLRNEAIPFPNMLILDTPMKNISERENKELYENFYKFILDIMHTELKDTQLILIDKEDSVFDNINYDECLEISTRRMTPDEKDFPGLIDYYEGH